MMKIRLSGAAEIAAPIFAAYNGWHQKHSSLTENLSLTLVSFSS